MRTALLIVLFSVSACRSKHDRDRIIAEPAAAAQVVAEDIASTDAAVDGPDSNGLVP